MLIASGISASACSPGSDARHVAAERVVEQVAITRRVEHALRDELAPASHATIVPTSGRLACSTAVARRATEVRADHLARRRVRNCAIVRR